jgi:hypothetical protein
MTLLPRDLAGQGNENNREQVGTRVATSQRGPRPYILVRTSINQYSMAELIQLLKWIASDGQLRTDEQIMDEMVAALGFSRRGARIEKAVQSAIANWRPRA